MSKYLYSVIYYQKDWKVLQKKHNCFHFWEPVGETVWLICWNGCACLCMGAKRYLHYFECSKAWGYSLTCAQQFHGSPSWGNRSFIPYSFLVMDKSIVWPKGVRDNREDRNNFCDVEACMLESFSCHTVFLDISENMELIKYNLTENTATIAVPQGTERKTFFVIQLIQTRDAWKERISFYLAAGVSSLCRLHTDHGHPAEKGFFAIFYSLPGWKH